MKFDSAQQVPTARHLASTSMQMPKPILQGRHHDPQLAAPAMPQRAFEIQRSPSHIQTQQHGAQQAAVLPMAVGDGLTPPPKSPSLLGWRGTPGRSPTGQVLGLGSLGSTGRFGRTGTQELAPSPAPPQRSQLLAPPARSSASAQLPAADGGRHRHRSQSGRDDRTYSGDAATRDLLQGAMLRCISMQVLKLPLACPLCMRELRATCCRHCCLTRPPPSRAGGAFGIQPHPLSTPTAAAAASLPRPRHSLMSASGNGGAPSPLALPQTAARRFNGAERPWSPMLGGSHAADSLAAQGAGKAYRCCARPNLSPGLRRW